VLVNDKIMINSILLQSAATEYYLDIAEGFNKIDFLALNQGESGPNTAAFTVYDENGVLITSNEWNLLTGVKATIIVFKLLIQLRQNSIKCCTRTHCFFQQFKIRFVITTNFLFFTLRTYQFFIDFCFILVNS
jgi:hypothetical protein